jgi:predicted site-specific integrase-resolvase
MSQDTQTARTNSETATQEPALLTKKQLAARLQCAVRTVENYVAAGRIPSLQLSKRSLRFEWLPVLTALRRGAK